MKTIFEPSDFRGENTLVGRVVHAGAGEHYLIGYDAAKTRDEDRYTLISLRDGMIAGSGWYGPISMAKMLNAGGYQLFSSTIPQVEVLIRRGRG